ncbi:hypothetical protein [Flavisolibacter nicotianae]|uniref:hypothetical protein n=1 Tax=Flavisolibacter nicotianae TaxID=2364882 RepID=UPI000EB0C95E|nr:hypothetical protein [Flavisolibacter nicotianae]
MEQQEQLLLETLLNVNKRKRRDLLPVWMKVFIWIFMIIGVIAPVCLLAGLSGTKLRLALYGLESNDSLSFPGMVILLLFILKGIVAFGLWTEKDWAITLGMADAMVGIAICVYITAIAPFVNNHSAFVLNLRLELAVLIPYLIKLRKIKSQWIYSDVDLA